MDARTGGSQAGAADARVTALMARVERLLAERRDAEAEPLWREAQSLQPQHPLVVHERARRLLASGDAAQACTLLQQLVAAAPQQLRFWLSLAAALRTLGRREEELDALEHALAIDPTHLVVLLQKGALLDLMNKPRSAAAVYTHALQALATGTPLPPAIEAHLRHAEQRVREDADALGQLIEKQLQTLPAHAASSDAPTVRFERCLDRVLGRRRVFTPQPTFLLFPYLRNYEFFPRETFPWLASLEAATETIRQELLSVFAEDGAGLEPYIAFSESLPINQWRELNHSRRWSAYFLWNQGRREESHLARCPRTAAVLEGLPQVDVPGRGPTAFFSILEPHTHIPPHTGVTNTRLTVHLPLIVPPGCRFRVGGDTREVRAGHAWVFDDTIEHEAWNDSDAPRAILIFDVWNPELSTRERDQVRAAIAALAQYYEAEGPVPGVVI
jgi:aspartate beta-hydroxylase